MVWSRIESGKKRTERNFDSTTILYERGGSEDAENTCRENYESNIADRDLACWRDGEEKILLDADSYSIKYISLLSTAHLPLNSLLILISNLTTDTSARM